VIRFFKQGVNASDLFNGNYFNTRRLALNKPAPTITKTKALLHPTEDRWLTIEECKAISTFPKDFKFIGSYNNQWARIRNAVMPKFMEAIALHIKKEILEKYYENN